MARHSIGWPQRRPRGSQGYRASSERMAAFPSSGSPLENIKPFPLCLSLSGMMRGRGGAMPVNWPNHKAIGRRRLANLMAGNLAQRCTPQAGLYLTVYCFREAIVKKFRRQVLEVVGSEVTPAQADTACLHFLQTFLRCGFALDARFSMT